MKKVVLAASCVALAACSDVAPTAPASNASSAYAISTAPGQNKIQCEHSGAATCTLNSNGAKGSATLTVTGTGDASVYYLNYNGSVYGNLLSSIPQLSFTYTGTPTPGSPRFSIPVDTNGDGLTDFWAYASAYYCNDGAGLVDVINDPTCTIYVSNDATASYPNWAAFVASQPSTAKVALTDNYLFVIADDIGTWTVNNVTIGKPGK